MRFVAIDGCPVPAKLAPEILEVKRRSGAVLTSCYRGSDPNGVRILRANGKKSQAELYDGFRRGLPGYNPANPPGRSTHELRNDGVAYPGPAGMVLRYWMVGQDWGSSAGAQATVRAASEVGFTATVTYPGNPREGHHINFRKEPKLKLFVVVKKGDSHKKVPYIRWALHFVHDPDTGKPYIDGIPDDNKRYKFFGDELEAALKKFQRDHGQKDDGVYGLQTARQLKVSIKVRRRRMKEEKER